MLSCLYIYLPTAQPQPPTTEGISQSVLWRLPYFSNFLYQIVSPPQPPSRFSFSSPIQDGKERIRKARQQRASCTHLYQIPHCEL